MEGIIRISGRVADITYQSGDSITLKLEPNRIYSKSMDECAFSAEKQVYCGENKHINVPYAGPARLDSRKDQAFCFCTDMENTPAGIGARTADINTGDLVVVYLHWHENETLFQTKHVIVDETIVHVCTPRPLSLTEFVTKIVQ